MYEVVLTTWPDFTEQVVGRCRDLREGQELARRLFAEQRAGAVRVWVRRVREAPAPPRP